MGGGHICTNVCCYEADCPSGHLVGTEKLVKMMRTKPTEVESLLDKVTDASIGYVEKIAEAGADVITVNEPSAAPELIDPPLSDPQ